MKLKAFVDSLDDVPEALHEYYTEQDDGRFMLNAEGVEDVSGLKSALGKERELHREAERKLKAFKDAGIDDPDAAKSALERVEELANFDPEKEADKLVGEKVKAREEQLIAAHQKELDKSNKRSETLLGQLQKTLVDAEATKAIAENKGAVDLLLPIVKDRTRLRENGEGDFTVEVLDANGNPRIGSAGGEAMTIAQYVSEMRESENYGRAFDGDAASGGGSPPDPSKPKPKDGKVKTISMSDQDAMNENLEGIAKGEVVVTE